MIRYHSIIQLGTAVHGEPTWVNIGHILLARMPKPSADQSDVHDSRLLQQRYSPAVTPAHRRGPIYATIHRTIQRMFTPHGEPYDDTQPSHACLPVFVDLFIDPSFRGRGPLQGRGYGPRREMSFLEVKTQQPYYIQPRTLRRENSTK